MGKHRLNPEELAVESFETQGLKSQRGTVRGHDSYPRSESTCYQVMCGCTYAEGTCDLSCMDPCQATNVNCNGCGGGGTGDTCGCQNTLEQTCCTGLQVNCSGGV
jgi:hypothetical protein